jgi:hypothetical protein
MPPELAGRVLEWRLAGEWADAGAAAVAEVLGELHAAITEGLSRKNDEHG